MSAATTRKITAQVGPKLMANADKFFNGSIETILDEIIQNARRAGASTIKFIRNGADLIVADNGAGLPADKADVLLQFGGSANEHDLDLRENAAGIGFFCLARYLVHVRSHNWSMKITPAAFRQQESAVLKTGSDHLPGMTLKIVSILPGDGDEKIVVWRNAIKSRVVYSGMTATLENFDTSNPDSIETIAARDFLSDQIGLHETTFELPGLKIKLVRQPRRESHDNNHQILVNFYGQTLKVDTKVHTILNPTIPAHETYDQFSTDSSYLETIRITNAIYIDVFNTSLLQLKLPDRKDIIATGNLDAVRAAIDAAFASMLRRDGVVNGIELTSEFRKIHKAPHPTFGIATTGELNRLRSHPLLMTPDPDSNQFAILLNAKGDRVDPSTIVAADDTRFLKAYAPLLPEDQNIFYDDNDLSKGRFEKPIPYLAKASLLIIDGDIEFETAQFAITETEEEFDLQEHLPEEHDITEIADHPIYGLLLRLHYENRPDTTLTVEIPCFAWDKEYLREESEFIVVKNAKIHQCLDIIKTAIDWLIEDHDAGTYDQQENDFERAIEHRLALLLKDPKAYRIEAMSNAISEVLWKNRPPANTTSVFTLTITTNTNGGWKVDMAEAADSERQPSAT